LPILIGFSIFAIGFLVILLSRLPDLETGLITALAFILGGAVIRPVSRSGSRLSMMTMKPIAKIEKPIRIGKRNAAALPANIPKAAPVLRT